MSKPFKNLLYKIPEKRRKRIEQLNWMINRL